MTIEFTAELEPVPFPRPASNGKRRFNPKRYSLFKEVLGHLAKVAMNRRAPLTGNIKLSVDFYRLKPRDVASRNWGDLDNHIKAVLDALNGIAFVDDRQVTRIVAAKHFGEPHINIRLEEL